MQVRKQQLELGSSSSGSEDNLLPEARVQELANDIPCVLILVCSVRRKFMYCTVNIGITAMYKGVPKRNNAFRTLRSCSVVQI